MTNIYVLVAEAQISANPPQLQAVLSRSVATSWSDDAAASELSSNKLVVHVVLSVGGAEM
jgi:hypothetical protein